MAGGWQEGGIRKAESRSHMVSSAGEFESTREPMKDLFSLLKKKKCIQTFLYSNIGKSRDIYLTQTCTLLTQSGETSSGRFQAGQRLIRFRC